MYTVAMALITLGLTITALLMVVMGITIILSLASFGGIVARVNGRDITGAELLLGLSGTMMGLGGYLLAIKYIWGL